MKKRRDSLARQKAPGAAAFRHERMLDEAARELNSNGVSLSSLGDIASRMGVSRATLYQYVADREDLVFQCYRRACEVMARHLGEAIRLGGDATHVLSIFVERMLDPTQPEIAARAEVAVLSPSRHETIQGLYDAITTRLVTVLESGAQAGVLRPCDATVTATAIISLVTWAPLSKYWSQASHGFAPDRFTKALIATLLDGLARDRSVAPNYRRIDLTPLLTRVTGVFNRDSVLDAKRETLLAIASRLFNMKGIDSTSLEEIAGQVGATKRTLYHHLGDKQALLAACYSRAFRIFVFIMQAMTTYQGTRLEALSAAFHALSSAYLRDDLSPLAPLVGHEALSRETQAQMEPHANALATGYFGAISSGTAEGTLPTLDIEARVLLLPGAFSWLVKDTGTHSEERIEHIASEISSLLSLGLRRN
jgi:AcrR family transcriptional regulator